jgi:tetratricopeptide (TPR) repeat protein
VESRDLTDTPLYLKQLDKIYHMEYLPDQKVLYVRQSQVQDQEGEDIPSFYGRVFKFIEENDVEKLILDLRLNGGGNNYKNKPVVTGIIRSQKIDQPGKFMVIIGRRTFSACMNLVNELDTYTNAVFVGEPTSENVNFYGDNRPVNLPNSGINAYLSFAWWQDKPQWENGPWKAPHLATGMTFEQYRTNQDPALEAALAFRDTTFITDPMAYLTRLFTSGKIEQVRAEAARMIADPNYGFFDFEAEFDKIASNLLDNSRIDESLFVSEMNAGFFPGSARVWLRRGEALLEKGQKSAALDALKKAWSIDPDGPFGTRAYELLNTVEGG